MGLAYGRWKEGHCSKVIRDGQATCITCADDVITDVSAATGRHSG
jgi:hypothetical protein